MYFSGTFTLPLKLPLSLPLPLRRMKSPVTNRKKSIRQKLAKKSINPFPVANPYAGWPSLCFPLESNAMFVLSHPYEFDESSAWWCTQLKKQLENGADWCKTRVLDISSIPQIFDGLDSVERLGFVNLIGNVLMMFSENQETAREKRMKRKGNTHAHEFLRIHHCAHV
jgi:hypothetical protein